MILNCVLWRVCILNTFMYLLFVKCIYWLEYKMFGIYGGEKILSWKNRRFAPLVLFPRHYQYKYMTILKFYLQSSALRNRSDRSHTWVACEACRGRGPAGWCPGLRGTGGPRAWCTGRAAGYRGGWRGAGGCCSPPGSCFGLFCEGNITWIVRF